MIGSVCSVGLAMYLVKVTEKDDLNLTDIKLSFTSIIYYQDRATGEFKEYQRLQGNENRIWVDLDDIPKHVQEAYIAVEDKDFYKHHGVNIKRTIGSMINEYTPIKLFSSKTGASTITQQLVKNLTNDQANGGLEGALRKIREIFRAVMLEKRYGKDVILEAYLNTLRLSGQLAGVQSGANNYFGKDVSELSISEAASLAGITKNPSVYNPFTNLENNIERRDDILYFMRQQGKITEEQYKEALAEKLVINSKEPTENTAHNSYFTDMVINTVIKDLMEDRGLTEGEATRYLYNGGLKIYSTVDPTLQAAMDKEYSESKTFPDVSTKKRDPKTGKVVLDEKTGEPIIIKPQAAMASVDYSGGIVGVVGGLGYKTTDRGLNRAVDSVRPVGSTMKPIGAYALGIDYNYINYSTGIEDSPFMDKENEKTKQMEPWPSNYSKTYLEADVPVVKAIQKSLNTIAVKTLDWVTPKVSYEFVKNTLHVSSLVPQDADYGPMALGSLTYGISPLEMAAAYAIFGNGGKYTTPHCYTTVEDSTGEVILETKVTTIQAISPETAYIMNRALNQVLQDGGTAGSRMRPKRLDAVGKTGTTSDNKDHWFIGVTPYYSTASWWGYDDQVELSVNFTTHPPTTAWRNVMNIAQADLPSKSFPVAKNVVVLSYCDDSGDLAGPGCPTQKQGYYKEDQTPGVCILHG